MEHGEARLVHRADGEATEGFVGPGLDEQPWADVRNEIFGEPLWTADDFRERFESAPWFDPQGWLYRTRRWERGGQVYDRVFLIRAWKRLLPDGSALPAGAHLAEDRSEEFQ